MKRYLFLSLAALLFGLCAATASAQTPAAEIAPRAASSSSDAEAPGILSRFKKRIISTWNADGFDIYMPVYTWHNRLLYDKDKAESFNEWPYGGGLGRSFIDEDGDSHSLYALGFADSNEQFQPVVGYAFLKNWYFGPETADKDFSVGLGFTLSITARHEYGYVPIPLPLPVAGIQYKNFAVQATYIPGGYNDGNVLFTWLRWHFD